MAKKKLPIEIRVTNKVKVKIEQRLPLKDISAYVASTMQQFKHKREAIFKSVRNVNPLIAESAKTAYSKLSKAKSDRKAKENDERQRLNHKMEKMESERIEELKSQYLSQKEAGSEIRWGVTLNPDDRKHFFSAKEIKEIVALRRDKISTYKVRQLLDCTLTEINRWDEDGLLPHAFKQVVQVRGKATLARFWLESEVLKKKPEIESWRESHRLKKSFKRKKSPLTKVVG